jgi:predicted secreted protein
VLTRSRQKTEPVLAEEPLAEEYDPVPTGAVCETHTLRTTAGGSSRRRWRPRRAETLTRLTQEVVGAA